MQQLGLGSVPNPKPGIISRAAKAKCQGEKTEQQQESEEVRQTVCDLPGA